MKLYHYTCTDSAPSIRRQRWLIPRPHPLLPTAGPLVWLTDLEMADRDALGLTSHTLNCDRTAVRVTVSTYDAEHWPTFARRISRGHRERVESTPGVMPMHWWVAPWPVGVLEVAP